MTTLADLTRIHDTDRDNAVRAIADAHLARLTDYCRDLEGDNAVLIRQVDELTAELSDAKVRASRPLPLRDEDAEHIRQLTATPAIPEPKPPRTRRTKAQMAADKASAAATKDAGTVADVAPTDTEAWLVENGYPVGIRKGLPAEAVDYLMKHALAFGPRIRMQVDALLVDGAVVVSW